MLASQLRVHISRVLQSSFLPLFLVVFSVTVTCLIIWHPRPIDAPTLSSQWTDVKLLFRLRVRDGLPPYDDDLPPAWTEVSLLLIVAGQRHRTKRIQVKTVQKRTATPVLSRYAARRLAHCNLYLKRRIAWQSREQ